MLLFTAKAHVCLVTPGELSRKRKARPAHHPEVVAHLWRQIKVEARSGGIRVALGNVDEESFNGGYTNWLEDCKEISLTWDDLLVRDKLMALFHHEPVCVWEKVDQMLTVFRDSMTSLRNALCAES